MLFKIAFNNPLKKRMEQGPICHIKISRPSPHTKTYRSTCLSKRFNKTEYFNICTTHGMSWIYVRCFNIFKLILLLKLILLMIQRFSKDIATPNSFWKLVYSLDLYFFLQTFSVELIYAKVHRKYGSFFSKHRKIIIIFRDATLRNWQQCIS